MRAVRTTSSIATAQPPNKKKPAFFFMVAFGNLGPYILLYLPPPRPSDKRERTSQA